MSNYPSEQTLMDITDTAGYTANQVKTYNAQGTVSGTDYMTAHTVNSSSTNGNYAAEITSVEVIPPQNTSLNYEDLRRFWFIQDNQATEHYVYLPGFGPILMNPLRTKLVGGASMLIRFGKPLWKCILDGDANMPLKNTTLKYSSRLRIGATSTYGVSSSGTGFRIKVNGYRYDGPWLQAMAKYYNPSFTINTFGMKVSGVAPITMTHVTAGPLSLATWDSYSGGAQQGAMKIMPYWHCAVNNKATSTAKAYGLSNSTDTGGGEDHVNDGFDDLGLPFAGTKNIFLLRGFGVRGAPLPPGQTGAENSSSVYTGGTPGLNLTRVAWNIGGTYYPEEEGGDNGIYVTRNVDTLDFGLSDGEDGRFKPVPLYPGEVVISNVNAVPSIVGDAGSIPADQVAVAMTGTIIEQVS